MADTGGRYDRFRPYATPVAVPATALDHSVSGGAVERTSRQAHLVCPGPSGTATTRAPGGSAASRFLADVTGDGRPDIVGFGGPGVYVARNLHRRFRAR